MVPILIFFSNHLLVIGSALISKHFVFNKVLTLKIHNFTIFQAFYVIFGACERASKEKYGNQSTHWENILHTPFEAIMRLFIMTIGEFTIFYRSLNTCEERMMQMIGKVRICNFEFR